MPCDWVQTAWNWGWGGSDGISVGIFISFSPSPYMIAQTTLSQVIGGGNVAAGISEYTVRPVPNGADEPVIETMDADLGYPSSVWDYNMSSVTAEMWVGGGSQAGAYNLTLYYLS